MDVYWKHQRKAREARVLKEQLARSKFGDAAAVPRDKRFNATDALVAPHLDALFPDLPLAAIFPACRFRGGGADGIAVFVRR